MSALGLRFRGGDRVVVVFTDPRGAPDPERDRAHNGEVAEIVELITKAWKDGYRVRFADGYETYAFDHECDHGIPGQEGHHA